MASLMYADEDVTQYAPTVRTYSRYDTAGGTTANDSGLDYALSTPVRNIFGGGAQAESHRDRMQSLRDIEQSKHDQRLKYGGRVTANENSSNFFQSTSFAMEDPLAKKSTSRPVLFEAAPSQPSVNSLDFSRPNQPKRPFGTALENNGNELSDGHSKMASLRQSGSASRHTGEVLVLEESLKDTNAAARMAEIDERRALEARRLEAIRQAEEARRLAAAAKAEEDIIAVPLPPAPTLDLSDMRAFMHRPLPVGMTIQCQVFRDRSSKLFPVFRMYLENPQTFLMAARKRKKSRTTNYLFSLDSADLSRDSDNFIGKMRSNFMGTEFVMYDEGESPSDAGPTAAESSLRQELGAIAYESNALGNKGPRRMEVLLPGLAHDNETRHAVRPRDDDSGLLDKHRRGDKKHMMLMHNKQPVFSEVLGTFALNFNKRVTKPSVKNFQLVAEGNIEDVLLQFGRCDEDFFTLDFSHPLSPFQAFCLAVCSCERKYGVE